MFFSRNELKPLLHQVKANDPDLTALHLSHKKIANRQLLQVSDALRTNSTVTEIWLTTNLIADDGGGGAGAVGYLMEVLESNRTVEEVYLGGNKIGAKGASSIANLVQKNNIITDIGLEDNVICDGGAKMLADALKHNDTLQTLKLQGNDIQTERTLQAITALLATNRERAKKKFAAEYPELATHKLTRPEKKKKEGRRRRPRSDGEETKHQRSKDPLTGRRGGGAATADGSRDAKPAAKPVAKPPSKLDKLKRGLSGGGGGGKAADPGKRIESAAFV